ncbi:MAG: ribbon-helix-helix domain-containing protein [Rhodospirillales bacterium]|nr:ribbon-helix-helix domain-containing protein [Rhodospirillales bacterium]
MRKRSIRIAGHRTSVALEAPFWEALDRLAAARGLSLAALVGEIDAGRGTRNLASALRLYVLDRAKEGALSTPEKGHETKG